MDPTSSLTFISLFAPSTFAHTLTLAFAQSRMLLTIVIRFFAFACVDVAFYYLLTSRKTSCVAVDFYYVGVAFMIKCCDFAFFLIKV